MSDLVNSLMQFGATVLIPIIAIVGGMSFAAYSMYLKVRRQREALQMQHTERMAAIEKGVELPPQSPELAGDRHWDAGYCCGRHRRRTSGITLVLLGAAITAALWMTNRDNSFWWGLVIVAWGLGRLISGILDEPRPGRYPGGPGTLPPGGNGPANGQR